MDDRGKPNNKHYGERGPGVPSPSCQSFTVSLESQLTLEGPGYEEVPGNRELAHAKSTLCV